MTTSRFVWDVVNDTYLSENDGTSTTAVVTNEPSQLENSHHRDESRVTSFLRRIFGLITPETTLSTWIAGFRST